MLTCFSYLLDHFLYNGLTTVSTVIRYLDNEHTTGATARGGGGVSILLEVIVALLLIVFYLEFLYGKHIE